MKFEGAFKEAIEAIEGHACMEAIFVREVFRDKVSPSKAKLIEALLEEKNYQRMRFDEISTFIDKAIKVLES